MASRFSKPIAFALTVTLHLALALGILWAVEHSSPPIPLPEMMTVDLIPPAAAPAPPVPPAAKAAPKAAPSPAKPKAVSPKPQQKAESLAPAEENSVAEPAPTPARKGQATTQEEPLTQPVFDAAYLQNPPPTYPAAARKRRVEGTVLLEVSVSAEGMAEQVVLHESSGSPLLDEAARKAVIAWRFIPAKQGDTPTRATVIVPVTFKLQD